MWIKNLKNKLGLVSGILLFMFILSLPANEAMSHEAKLTAACAVLMAIC